MKKSRLLLILASTLLVLSSCGEEERKDTVKSHYPFYKEGSVYYSAHYFQDTYNSKYYKVSAFNDSAFTETHVLNSVYGSKLNADKVHYGYHFSHVKDYKIYFEKDNFNIEYSGFDMSSVSNPTTYTIIEEGETNTFKLSPYFTYYDLDKEEYLTELPVYYPRNLRLRAELVKDEAEITYHNVEGLTNPNPDTLPLNDSGDVYTLKNISTPTGVSFLGWYVQKDLDEEGKPVGKITSLYPLNGITEVYAHFSSASRTFTMYDENNKQIGTADYNFDNRYDVMKKNLPKRDGKVCEWDIKEIPTLKNYDLHLVVKDAEYKISLVDIDSGLKIGDFNCRHGDSYKVLNAKAPEDKYINKLYYDVKGEKEVGASDTINGEKTIYCSLKNVEIIANYEDFLKLYDKPKGAYKLSQDINFGGAAVKPITSFEGTLDGGNWSLKNFKLTNHKNASNFALFTNNKGTIKNIKVTDFEASEAYTGASNDTIQQGILTSINDGVLENITIKDTTSAVTTGVTQTNVSNSNSIRVGLVAATNNGSINNVTIKNVGLSTSNVVGYGTYNMGGNAGHHGKIYNHQGLAVGYNAGTLSNVTVEEDATISSNCDRHQNDVVPTSSITYETHVGIVCGTNDGLITGANASGSLSHGNYEYLDNGNVKQYHAYNFGAVAGRNLKNIEKSFVNKSNLNIGNIYVTDDYSINTGMITGLNSGKVTTSYVGTESSGIIRRTSNVLGGLFGNNTGVVSNCYTKATLSTTNYGATAAGFGVNNSGTIEYCYAIPTFVKDGDNTSSVYCGAVRSNKEGGVISHCFVEPSFPTNEHIGFAYKFGHTNAGKATYCFYSSASSNGNVPEEKWGEEGILYAVENADSFKTPEFVFGTEGLNFNDEIWYISGKYPVFL